MNMVKSKQETGNAFVLKTGSVEFKGFLNSEPAKQETQQEKPVEHKQKKQPI